MKTRILILSLFASVVLSACKDVNSHSDTAVTTGADTITEAEISVSKTDALINAVEELSKEPESKLLFKASGFEPGWLLSIHTDKLKLISDYGKDSILINDDFNTLTKDKAFTYSNNSNFSLNITNKPCNDEATGEKKDCSVSIQFKGKNFKGCGSFEK